MAKPNKLTQDAADVDGDHKPHPRSLHWQFNIKLLVGSATAITSIAIVVAFGYWYQSGNIADSLMNRAATAGAAKDWEKQITWLQQLQILKPDDQTTALELAKVADQAVELPPANRYDRVQRARNLLSEAIAILRKEDTQDQTGELEGLERKLIERELQFGPLHANSVRRRVIALNADKKDKDLLRAFAMAKHAISSTTEDHSHTLDEEAVKQGGDFWLWLDQQPLSRILTIAWNANPKDVDLAGLLANEVLENPDSFPSGGEVNVRPIDLALKGQLAEMQDDGQAQLILYSMLLPTDPEAAASLLDSQVAPALSRLSKAFASANPTVDAEPNTESAPGLTIPILPPAHATRTYRPLWDFNLGISWARAKLQETNPDYEKLDSLLDQLLALQFPTIPAGMIQDTYILRTLQRPEEREPNTNTILLAGIKRLGIESPELQLRRAARLSNNGDLEDAKAAVKQFSKTLLSRRARLVGTGGIKLTPEQKSAEEVQLDNLAWSKNVMLGMIASRDGRLGNARRTLQDALQAQVAVSSEKRLQATLLLADIYRRMGVWDLAATTFESASVISPDKQELRVLAAEAWTAAGNASNAFAQWKTVNGNSPRLQVQQLRALIAEEFAKPPSSRNFEIIWRRLDKLDQRLKILTESDDNPEDLNGITSELALLALAIPDRDDGSARKSTLQRLLQLAEESPDDASIQKVAALSLARTGEIATGRKLLQRLRDLEGDNSLPFTLTNAKFEAATGNLEEAIDGLLAYTAKNTDNVIAATMLAAEYMASQNTLDRAYQVLMDVPSAQHTSKSSFALFSYALAGLPSPITNDTDFSRLIAAEQLLFDIEESTETWWKLAKAIRLLTESSNQDLPAEKSADLITEASELSAEISSNRPRWGLGLSLAGKISAARGETNSAIQSLQAGISNGDIRLSTSYLLTQLLLKMNRVVEAESEYSRFERLRQANSNIAAFGISIAERKGEYKKSLELARQTAESNDQDEIAWLLVAQAAMMAARSTDEKLTKDALLSEARTALDVALELSGDASVRAYQMRLRFSAEFFGDKALRVDVAKLAESEVSEPTRSLLSGLAYIQIKEGPLALPLLKRAEKYSPSDPQVFIALSEYYQLVGDNPNTIASLEQAFKLAPSRVDIRNRLAIAIALRSGADIPWPRLKSLLDTNLIGDAQNKLLHALILLNRGNQEQEQQAELILTQLVKSNDPKADDARRLLASLLRQRWGRAASIDENAPEAQRALSEARGVYLTLINRDKPQPLDIYRLGDLLLRAEQTQDVTALADQLDAITKGSAIALDLRLRLAKQAGHTDKIEEYANDWTTRAMEVDGLLQASVWETAGQLLSRLGYHKESIAWLERAYRDDSEKFRPYILGLTRARRFDEAIRLCTEQYAADHAANTASVLADVAVLMGLGIQARPLSQKEEAVLQQALQEHPKNASLLEAVATMRLAQERYSEAIPLYLESAKFSPNNVRLLNNLAMALSEISGREREAIPYARRAIKLYGRSPELLDTLGLVLVRNDEGKEAEQVLREAVNASPDPRYRFHLLVALLDQGKRVEAISQWSKLDLNALKKSALTPAERRDLNKVRKRFES